MKNYTIKELLERKDRRDSKLHMIFDVVSVVYTVIFILVLCFFIKVFF